MCIHVTFCEAPLILSSAKKAFRLKACQSIPLAAVVKSENTKTLDNMSDSSLNAIARALSEFRSDSSELYLDASPNIHCKAAAADSSSTREL